jgi:hypothetical protein
VKAGAERRQRAVSKKGQPVGVAVLPACGLSADNVGPMGRIGLLSLAVIVWLLSH